MKKRIFISYRRNDTQYQVDDFYDALIKHTRKSNVFKDIESIAVGENYENAINEAVEKCDICFVAIGPNWMSEENKARLFSEKDYVRHEIEEALKREDVVVVPVLFDSVMPSAEDLPESIKELHYRNAYTITRKHKEQDIKDLIHSLGVARKGGFLSRNKEGKSTLAKALTMLIWFFIGAIFLAILIPNILKARQEAENRSYRELSANDTAWHSMMDSLADEPKVDAAVNYERYDAMYLFWDWEYMKFSYSNNAFADFGTRSFSEYWKGAAFDGHFDAALNYPPLHALYLFKGHEYIKWDTRTDKAAEGFPKSIATNWFGVWKSDLDAAFYYAPNKSVYFFKGDEYMIYNTETEQVEPGYPKKIENDWPDFLWIDWVSAAAVVKNTTTVAFFRGYHSLLYDMELKKTKESTRISDLSQFSIY